MNAQPAPFEFKISTGVAPPEHTHQPRVAANAHPFLGLFDRMEEAAKKGENPHLFVPTSYWTGRAEDKEAAAKFSYGSGKLAEHFKKWQKAAQKEGARDHLYIQRIQRTGTEDIEDVPEAGISLWMRAKEAEEAKTPKK